MSVDKFGRYNVSSNLKAIRGPPGEGFNLTGDGNYNILNKRLCNVAEPKSPLDAVNKRAMVSTVKQLEGKIYYDITKEGLDFKNVKLTNIGAAAKSTDAVNKDYMFRALESYKKDIENNCDRKIHYVKTQNGLDYKNEKLHNIGSPSHESDAVNLSYLTDMLNAADDKLINMVYNMYADITKGKSINNITEFKNKYIQ